MYKHGKYNNFDIHLSIKGFLCPNSCPTLMALVASKIPKDRTIPTVSKRSNWGWFKLLRPKASKANTNGILRYNNISKKVLESLFWISGLVYSFFDSTSLKIDSKTGMKTNAYIRVV